MTSGKLSGMTARAMNTGSGMPAGWLTVAGKAGAAVQRHLPPALATTFSCTQSSSPSPGTPCRLVDHSHRRHLPVSSIQPVTIADEGVRLRRLTRLLFAVVWVIPAVLAALQLTLVGDASGAHYSVATALLWQGASWMLWGLWSQVVLTLVDRVKLDTTRILP